MSDRVDGNVINVHALGATVRLEDGRLAAAPIEDVAAHRAAYVRALASKSSLAFEVTGRAARLASARPDEALLPGADPPSLHEDAGFEAQMNAYLKQTEDWAPSDRPAPLERHLFRKRQRAKQFRGDPAPEREPRSR